LINKWHPRWFHLLNVVRRSVTFVESVFKRNDTTANIVVLCERLPR